LKEITVHSKKYGDQISFVDDSDYLLVNQYNWWLKKHGRWSYALTTLYLGGGRENQKTKKVRMHRMILDAPKGILVDHIDYNGLNNQRSNLRLCTNQENVAYQRNLRGGVSKYKGVWFRTDVSRNKPWTADIKVNYKKISLGVFNTEEEAALAYNEAVLKYFGDFAVLNEVN
jgi:hypothetical protein